MDDAAAALAALQAAMDGNGNGTPLNANSFSADRPPVSATPGLPSLFWGEQARIATPAERRRSSALRVGKKRRGIAVPYSNQKSNRSPTM